MGKGYTYEELVQMGATPAPPQPESKPKGYTYDELARAGAVPTPTVGGGETWLNNTVNILPSGKPVVDALSAAVMQGARALGVGEPGVHLTPQAKAEASALGLPVEEGSIIPGVLDTYRDMRDTRALRTAAGSEQNPWARRIGKATGVGLTLLAPLPKASVGSGVSGSLLSGALTGAGYGALTGLTEGDADLTRGEFGQAAKDTLIGTGLGAGLGFLGSGVVEAAKPLLGKALRALALRQGKQVIQGGSDIAAATRKSLSDESVEEVLQSGGIRPFSTTQKTFARIGDLSEEQGKAYANIVAELEARGVQGPDVRKLADDIFERYRQEWPRTAANKAVPDEYFNQAANIEAISQGRPRLGLSQTEALKQDLQRQARFDRLTNSATEESKQEVSSMVRQANEDAISAAAQAAGPGSEIADVAERFVPTKQRLSRLLEARTAAERGAAKAEQRGPVSLKDYIAGSATGDPVSALATALASGMARNRLPSAIASGAYGLSKSLQSGGVSPAMARYFSFWTRPAMSQLDDYLLPAFTEEEEQMRKQKALAEAIRRRQ